MSELHCHIDLVRVNLMPTSHNHPEVYAYKRVAVSRYPEVENLSDGDLSVVA